MDNRLKELEIEERLQKRGRLIRDSLVKRLEKNPVQIVKVKIEMVEDSTKKVLKNQIWKLFLMD
jgi:hypothetical protein